MRDPRGIFRRMLSFTATKASNNPNKRKNRNARQPLCAIQRIAMLKAKDQRPKENPRIEAGEPSRKFEKRVAGGRSRCRIKPMTNVAKRTHQRPDNEERQPAGISQAPPCCSPMSPPGASVYSQLTACYSRIIFGPSDNWMGKRYSASRQQMKIPRHEDIQWGLKTQEQ